MSATTSSGISGSNIIILTPEQYEELQSPDIMPMSAGSVYDGTISTTIVQYFKDITKKLPYGSNYVFYRSGQYDYTLAYSSDLKYASSRYSSPRVNMIVYDSRNYTLSQTTNTNYTLSTNYLVYSSLGEAYTPTLYEVGRNEFETISILLCVAILFAFVVRLFK